MQNHHHHDSNVERSLLREMQKENSALVERVRKENRIILHNFQKPVPKSLCCDLEGCGRNFTIQLIPNQVVYPRFCPSHRTEHRRQHFREKSKKFN